MGKYNSRETCNYETSFFLCRNQSPVNITKNVFDRKPIKQCKIYQKGNFFKVVAQISSTRSMAYNPVEFLMS